MKRRSFLKKASFATAAAYTAPYILPSGRLFAATGSRLANHVVFCLFGGGVRNLESVHKSDGNLMRNTLEGNQAISQDIAGDMDFLPLISGPSLQSQGTLFQEFRYKQGPTGHYNGHSTAITGVYTTNNLNIKQAPKHPTVFEYYRKHTLSQASALNAWWVSDSLGPYPFLNFSSDPNYGANYGANYIQSLSLISQSGYNALANSKIYSPTEEEAANTIRTMLDKNFSGQYLPGDAGVENTNLDRNTLETDISSSLSAAISGSYIDPWGVGANVMNRDMYNVFFAEQIINSFSPELLVVNMQNIDICHSDFTGYCNNIRKADFALAHLWDTIQNTPGMANDTVLIAVPEHGRNLTENTLIDANGRFATDHTGEPMSREIFCLIAGPSGVVVQGQKIGVEMGESIDVVPTIGKVLGFYDDIPMYYKSQMGSALDIAFV